jgi:Spy/CpxP family protein refolding chaperone
MKRTLAMVGVAVLAVVGAVVTAQGPAPEAQRGAGPGVNMAQRGPGRALGIQGQGVRQGPGFRRGPQGAMRGRGQGGPGVGRRGGPGFGLRGLDLTDDQKAQIKAVHEKARQDVDAILTPEQKAKRRGGR